MPYMYALFTGEFVPPAVAGIPYSVTVQPEYSAGLGKVGHVPIEYSQELSECLYTCMLVL